MPSPRITATQLPLPAQELSSAVLLESQRAAPPSHRGSRKPCRQPGAVTAGEVLARKQDWCWMAQEVCLLLQEWEQLSSSKSDELHWVIGGLQPQGRKAHACAHSCNPDLPWGSELGWSDVVPPQQAQPALRGERTTGPGTSAQLACGTARSTCAQHRMDARRRSPLWW